MPKIMEPNTGHLPPLDNALEVSLRKVVRVKRFAVFLTKDQFSSSLAFP